MGGPDSLQAVKPFLSNLFSDRDIIKLGPSFLQKPIASLIIKMKLKKTLAAYELIGGKSPLPEITSHQASALEASLNGETSHNANNEPFKVYIAMRYWHPLTEGTVAEINRSGIKKIIVIPLYPQYSRATTGSSIKKLIEEFAVITSNKIAMPKQYQRVFSIQCPPFTLDIAASWYDNPIYIETLTDKINKGMQSFITGSKKSKDVPVLFSAHSLPQKFIDEGDPYVQETKGTVDEILKRINIESYISYQSKSGPVKWLEPSTEDMIIRLAKKGVKNLLVVPISFVSDHIETLYEIDMLYKDMAHKLGMNLQRTESLNISPKFIEALADIARKFA
jgi:ferrochelatase